MSEYINSDKLNLGLKKEGELYNSINDGLKLEKISLLEDITIRAGCILGTYGLAYGAVKLMKFYELIK